MDYPVEVWLGFLALGVVVVVLSAKALRQKPSFGKEGMEGSSALALTDLSPRGTVFCHGEIWKARSVGGSIPKGSQVVVDRVEGLTLVVRPDDEKDGKTGGGADVV
ncbi:NfeD family protein [Thermanaerovibrio acidaminovorans]|uniref:NfeD-like C-terminal domain-containing protein n=1 Tax=Thermanaerovibrio acidaminovorans (strain ATCC 49978 / DSM 6589 / Su883) TaxID=525903 RepID=D1B9H9_THEAS|nr:NfeD family protein [Thermanaerovibrio acidaminovorans]ACZ18932.1 protein of unknown function DUF107 [Thermanaerovibrio acidaminovorans DSM 6589]